MKIGSLFDDRLGKGITYSYFIKGTDIKLNPDETKEMIDLPEYSVENGNLFYKRLVEWNYLTVYNSGVDLKISIGEKTYIDHIELNQGKGNAIKSVEVYTIADKKYKKIGKYTSESNSLINTEEITVKVGAWCDNLVVRFNTEETKITIKSIDVFAAWDMEDAVWPLPENMEVNKETFSFNSIKSILARNEDEKFVAEFLNEKLDFKFDKTLPVSETEGEITFDIKGDGYDDGYTLVSKDGKVTITSTNRRSALYAVEALIQLTDSEKVKYADINHTAFKPIRGFHTGTPCKDQIEFFKNLIKYVLVPLHYNMLFLEIAGTLEYEKYPEINSTYLEGLEDHKAGKRTPPAHSGMLSHQIWTKSELRELCQFMEDYGVEVVPEVQSLGHVQYITSAYPEMAEIYAHDVEPMKDFAGFSVGDPGPGKFEYHTLCPNHPKYYEVIFNIIDEVLEAVQPKRFVHMGHDEVFPLGVCERCKNIPQSEILTTEVNALNAYLKEKGYRMMIWGDMLQDIFYHNTSSSVRTIDKDIIMLDFVWYYDFDKDYEENLVKHGFEVLVGNLYSSGFDRYETRIRKEGMLGGQVSTWVACEENDIGYLGKFFDLCYTANMLVNSRYDHNMRLTYTEMIKPYLDDMRIKIADLKTKGEETKVAINGKSENVPYDIKGIVPYNSAVLVDNFDKEATIEVNKKGSVISFVQATDIPARKVPWVEEPSVIGKYVIEYEDGTKAEDRIVYSKNIHHYLSRYGNPLEAKGVFRHLAYAGTYFISPISGKTYNGDDYTLGKYMIKNKYPEKTIKNIKVVKNGEAHSAIMIFDVSILN